MPRNLSGRSFCITVAARVADKGKFNVAGYDVVAERHFGLKPCKTPETPDVPNSPTARLDEVVGSKGPIQTTQVRDSELPSTERKRILEVNVASIEPELSEEGTSSSEESDLESCTIEVGGVNKSTSLETLRMFFESRRTSRGGKIDGDIGRTANGNYIISFKDREGKFIGEKQLSGSIYLFVALTLTVIINTFTKILFTITRSERLPVILLGLFSIACILHYLSYVVNIINL